METTIEHLRRQSRAELASTVRMVTAIGIGAHFVLAAEEWLRLGTLPPALIATKVAMILGMCAVIAALSTQRGRRRVVFVCLTSGMVLAPLIVLHAVLLDETFLAPLAAILWTMVSATLPWPLRYHAIVVLGSITTIIAAQLFLGQPRPLSDPLVAGSFVLIAASLFVAHANNRKRRELRRAQAQLRESETRFRQLAEYSKDIIWVWSPEPRLEYISPALENYTGSSRAPLYQDALAVLDLMRPADRLPLRKAIKEVSLGRSQTLDLSILHRDGTEHAFEAWGAPIKDHHGRVVRGIGVWRDITKRRQMARELSTQASTDPLTGISNQRFLRDVAQEQLDRAERHGTTLSIILFDIDHFKVVNDQFGHLAGDHVLKEIAQRTRNAIRESDTLARYGGEEFVVLLTETNQAQAVVVAEKVRGAITATPIIHDDRAIEVTASFGVASSDGGIKTAGFDSLLQRADQALYAAKNAGRDCVRTLSQAQDS